MNRMLPVPNKSLTRTSKDDEQAVTPSASLLGIPVLHTTWDALRGSHQPPPTHLLHLPISTPLCHKHCLILPFCRRTKPCSALSAEGREDEESPEVGSLPARDPRAGHLPVPCGVPSQHLPFISTLHPALPSYKTQHFLTKVGVTQFEYGDGKSCW